MGDVTFGDVRAMLAREPERAWRGLHRLALGYHDPREWREVVVPYASAQMSQWPVGAPERLATHSMLMRRAIEVRWDPMLDLCDAVEFDHDTIGLFGGLMEHVGARWRRVVFTGEFKKKHLAEAARVEGVEVDELVWRSPGHLGRAWGRSSRADWFAGARRLEVHGAVAGAEGMRRLAEREGLGVTELWCDGVRVDEGMWRAMSGAPWSDRLVVLGLRAVGSPRARRQERWGVGELREVFEEGFASGFGSLRELDMSGLELGGAAVAVAQGLGPRLERAEFVRCAIDDAALAGMIEAGVFERARVVDLRGNDLTRRGFEALASARLPSLERLRLWRRRTWDAEWVREYAGREVWSEQVREGLLADMEG